MWWWNSTHQNLSQIIHIVSLPVKFLTDTLYEHHIFTSIRSYLGLLSPVHLKTQQYISHPKWFWSQAYAVYTFIYQVFKYVDYSIPIEIKTGVASCLCFTSIYFCKLVIITLATNSERLSCWTYWICLLLTR